MSERNPLHRFSQRRRLRRQEHLVDRSVAKRNAAKDQRVGLNVRTSVLPACIARLSAAGKAFEFSRSRLVGAILEWFSAQPKLIQAAVIGRPIQQRSVDFSGLVLQRLLQG
jgi:hypothetical protein